MVKNPLAAGFKGGVANYLRSWKKLLSSLRGWHEYQISSGYFGCREKGLGRSRGESLLDQQAKPGMSVQGRINESRVAPITLHVGTWCPKRHQVVHMSMLMGFELQSLDYRESVDLNSRNIRIGSSS